MIFERKVITLYVPISKFLFLFYFYFWGVCSPPLLNLYIYNSSAFLVGCRHQRRSFTTPSPPFPPRPVKTPNLVFMYIYYTRRYIHISLFF